MEIIKEREYIENYEYVLSYIWKDDKGCGFSFPCTEEGEYIDNPASRENYNKCVNGEYDVVFEGVQKLDFSYWAEAVGRCYCGEEVQLGRFTNTCDACGCDYNSFGQLLSDRSCWGEETGETYADIVGTVCGDDWY